MYISGDKQTKAKTTAKAATAKRAPVSIDMRQLPANENSRSAIYDNQRRRQPRCQQLQQPIQQQQQQRQQLIGNCCRVWRCSAASLSGRLLAQSTKAVATLASQFNFFFLFGQISDLSDLFSTQKYVGQYCSIPSKLQICVTWLNNQSTADCAAAAAAD